MHSDDAPPPPASSPEQVLAVYRRDAPLHPYGIADVAQLWDRSTWWCDGPAVVGVIDLQGSPVPVVYAVSAAPAATNALLRRLAATLPDRFMATGPAGMTAVLADQFGATFCHPYWKMHLAQPAALPSADPRVTPLTRDDLPALERLFATDELAGDFFHAGLLDTGLYLGLWEGTEVAAAGGIHVIDEQHGVAAIGNVATHPAHRRRGLARGLVATLCHRLLDRVPVVGLNVRQDNVAAHALYRALGFATLRDYEEAELVRR